MFVLFVVFFLVLLATNPFTTEYCRESFTPFQFVLFDLRYSFIRHLLTPSCQVALQAVNTRFFFSACGACMCVFSSSAFCFECSFSVRCGILLLTRALRLLQFKKCSCGGNFSVFCKESLSLSLLLHFPAEPPYIGLTD